MIRKFICIFVNVKVIKMYKLSLPEYNFACKKINDVDFLFDIIRKKYVKITPEEWVRQHIVHFLITEKKYPASLIGVEVSLTYNKMQKRADIVCYNSQAQPLVLIECKAPSITITQSVFEQIATYNAIFKVPYLVVSNGIAHYACTINYEEKSFLFLKDIPSYGDLK